MKNYTKKDKPIMMTQSEIDQMFPLSDITDMQDDDYYGEDKHEGMDSYDYSGRGGLAEGDPHLCPTCGNYMPDGEGCGDPMCQVLPERNDLDAYPFDASDEKIGFMDTEDNDELPNVT